MTATSIQGDVVRSVGLGTFTDITEVPLVMPGGIDRNGLLFDGELTDDQVGSIWWRATSVDASDEAARRNLSDLRMALAAADLSTADGLEALRAAVVAALDYTLGDT